MDLTFHLEDTASTEALGRGLALTRPPLAVVYLRGDLGAGKSTLARALLRALGVEGTIRSPTYTLVERYPLGEGREAWHLDLYRIADPGELEYLGLDGELVTLWLVEWPEKGAGALPVADLVVDLAIGRDGRRARVQAGSTIGRSWLSKVGNEVPFAPDS